MVPADAVPLQHGELGVVALPGLAVAEHAAELVAVADAGREQAFHRVFGRGTQPAFARARIGVAAERGAEAVDVRFGVAGGAEDRRLDLQHAAPGKEIADQRVQRRAQRQRAPQPFAAVAAGSGRLVHGLLPWTSRSAHCRRLLRPLRRRRERASLMCSSRPMEPRTRHLHFSSLHVLLTTLLGLALITLVGVGVRLLAMQVVQQRRERENRPRATPARTMRREVAEAAASVAG